MSSQIELVFAKLSALGIAYEAQYHPPTPTIDDVLRHWKNADAVHCKNLFFRNHKGNQHYLVIFDCLQNLSIRDLEQRLKQGKLSFASEKRMTKYLGVQAGSVSPFGLLNDIEKHVILFIDENLRDMNRLSFHPNDNTCSVAISVDDFIRYLDHQGNVYKFLKLY
jgi:Ala-tRNA(Pro) deacylase